MDVQYLHEFVILAKICNYQEAAEELHMSQSALSKHIQKLEEELGVALFDRGIRTVVLSKYGQAFLPYARQMSDLREEALQSLQRIQAEETGRLVVACPPALERYGLVELLAAFRRAHPTCCVECIRSVDPVGALRAGRCEFAFAQADIQDKPDILGEIYQVDYPVAVLPKQHPLASAGSVSMTRLREEHFILHSRAEESTTIPQATLERLCDSAGFTPDIVMSASFSSTIVSLVSQGLGIAIMQRLQVPEHIGGVALVRIEADVSTDIQLLYRNTLRMTPIRTEFLHHVRQLECSKD